MSADSVATVLNEIKTWKYYGKQRAEEISAEVEMAVEAFRERNHVYWVFQPGNATRYDLVITQVTRGQKCVSMPNFGVSMMLDAHQTDIHFDYVARHLKLNEGDAVPVAIFLTLFLTTLAA